MKESWGEIKLFGLINPHQNFIELFTYIFYRLYIYNL